MNTRQYDKRYVEFEATLYPTRYDMKSRRVLINIRTFDSTDSEEFRADGQKLDDAGVCRTTTLGTTTTARAAEGRRGRRESCRLGRVPRERPMPDVQEESMLSL
ncbi:hypothetical protein R1flu_025462 [Riccia fluitans]|uniref:Uncharacterized protein n=1 Tax=Riccia fluitans TaxID=41844 RepID=A0ABD1XXU1_9MARC